MTIADADFQRLVGFMKNNYGIDLGKKQHLIAGRLSSTIESKGFTTFSQYVEYITTSQNEEDIDVLINKLTTNYTFFMREVQHFDYFRDTVLPWLEQTKTNKVLSIWSAGCSSGQEPYTLSMIMKEYFGPKASQWDTRVLATDISQNILSTAKAAEYEGKGLTELPPGWKEKYFKQTGKDLYTVVPDIKNNVIFRTFNLMDPIRFKIPFDVIFCRNVMIYFDAPTKDALTNRFYDATNPGGYLMIGHSESLTKGATKYNYLMPATYRKPL